jgi:hypothetical protein
MKQIGIFFLLALLFSYCASDEQTSQNTNDPNAEPKYLANYTSEAGMFKCYFPESFIPEEKVKQLESEDGIIEVHTIRYQTDDLLYSVKYTDYPKAAMEKYSPQEIMKNDTKGPIVENGYKIKKEETNLEFDGCPGQIFMWEEYNPETMETIYIYRKDIFFLNRFYSLVLMRKNGYPTDKDIKMYSETFTLTK